MRSRRSSDRSNSGACSRAATTARHAGTLAAIRGRTRVSIGMPCSRAIIANAADRRSGVKSPWSVESESPTMQVRHSRWSP